MFSVFVTHDSLPKWKQISFQREEITASSFMDLFWHSSCFQEGPTPTDVYILVDGRKLCDDDMIKHGQHVHLCNRLPGGKGGFGSMLRAIGAQIEKTTNREACRDLSGRRLRDIAEEMRLKKWIAKQNERDLEKAARRREKLERRLTTPRHEFKDPTYDKQRSEIPEKVHDALMQGLAVSKSSSSSKRPGPEIKNATKKPKLWLGVQEDLEDGPSSDEMETSSTSSSSEDSDTPGPTVVDQSNSSASTSPENLPGSSKQPTKHLEEPVQESPTHTAIPETSAVLTETCSDETTQEITTPEQGETKQNPIDFNLNDFDSVDQLESLGLDRLKAELTALGMKCGGTLQQRAERLFSVKGLSADQIKPSLLARPPAKLKK